MKRSFEEHFPRAVLKVIINQIYMLGHLVLKLFPYYNGESSRKSL